MRITNLLRSVNGLSSLNILNKYVDYFVIVEGKKDHQGNIKKLNFKMEKFSKFKDKIRYIVADDFPKSDYTWDLEHYQRNTISEGLFDVKEDDLIMDEKFVKDVDAIMEWWRPKAVRRYENLRKKNDLNEYTLWHSHTKKEDIDHYNNMKGFYGE